MYIPWEQRGAGQAMKPLGDLIVIDFTHHLSGPYCTMMLADMGAKVLKIEPPITGEAGRHNDSVLKAPDGSTMSSFFVRTNRNKRSVALDLKHPEGREAALRLIRNADIVVENFRPGKMEELGLGYDDVRKVNPRIIYASISGYGSLDLLPGPYAHRPAFAAVAEAMGGITDLAGTKDSPPVWGGYGLGDLFPAVVAYGGILTALHKRTVTGEGSRVDVAMYDSIAALNERAVALYSMTGRVLTRGGESVVAPFGVFKAADGYVTITVLGEAVWARFCQAIGRPELADDPRLNSGEKRAAALDELLKPIIEDWLAQRPLEESVAILLEHSVPASPVQNARDVATCPHLEARRMFADMTIPGFGTYRLMGNPIKISGHVETPVEPPPAVGDATVQALKTLAGYTDAEIERLLAAGVASAPGWEANNGR